MGAYVSVRGWVECAQEQLAAVREVLRRHDDGFCSGGWSVVRGPNGDFAVMYCGTIRDSGVDWLLGVLREAATTPPPDGEPLDRIRGLFLAHHEETGMQEWQVRDGVVVVAPLPDRYDYLQA